jgi:hypothetical protein
MKRKKRKFLVRFTAVGEVEIEATSQAEAEETELTDEQVANGISDVKVLEVVNADEEMEDRCPKCGAEKVSRMVSNEVNPQDKSLTEERVCPVCK